MTKKYFGGVLVGGTQMLLQQSAMCEMLKTLSPQGSEQMGILRFVIRCAELLRGRDFQELQPQFSEFGLKTQDAGGVHFDVRNFSTLLPEDARTQWHGLMEALEIYASIHGHPATLQKLASSETALRELRQIRDICLLEGLHSIY